MLSTRLVVPLVTGIALVLLGLVVARVVAQEDTGPVDYSPMSVPTSPAGPTASPTPSPSESPDPSPAPTTAAPSQAGDDDSYQRVPQTPRAIDDDDDDDDHSGHGGGGDDDDDDDDDD